MKIECPNCGKTGRVAPETIEMIARCKSCHASFKVKEARVPELVTDGPPANNRSVFISYSSNDRVVANTVRRSIEDIGLRCWMAPESVPPGQDYGGAIVEGIRGCSAFVLVFSRHSNASKQVLREVERASSLDKTVITFRIDNVTPTQSMEYFLSSPHRLDANGGSLDEHVNRLALVLQRMLLSTPEGSKNLAPVAYSPNLLADWNGKLLRGGLAEVFDCSNEILMHDLRDALRQSLEAKQYQETGIENCEIGLVELYRNVARHARSPIGRVEIVIDFQRNRFILTVASQGPAFRLDDALAKYAKLPKEQRTIHGLQNLCQRGELHLSRDALWNVLIFSTTLAPVQKKESVASPICFELHPSKVRIGEQSYAYSQWIELLSEDSQDLSLELESLIRKITNTTGTLTMKLHRKIPDWTKSPSEMQAIRLFDRCMEIMKSNSNYRIVTRSIQGM